MDQLDQSLDDIIASKKQVKKVKPVANDTGIAAASVAANASGGKMGGRLGRKDRSQKANEFGGNSIASKALKGVGDGGVHSRLGGTRNAASKKGITETQRVVVLGGGSANKRSVNDGAGNKPYGNNNKKGGIALQTAHYANDNKRPNINGQWGHDKFMSQQGGGGGSNNNNNGKQQRGNYNFNGATSIINTKVPGSILGAQADGPTEARIRNFHPQASRDDIRLLFKEFEPIERCEIMYDSMGRSMGEALLMFSTRNSAMSAKHRFDGQILDGLKMEIEVLSSSRMNNSPYVSPTVQSPMDYNNNNNIRMPYSSTGTGKMYMDAHPAMNARSGIPLR